MLTKQQWFFELGAVAFSTLCSFGIQAYQNANFTPTQVPNTTINFYFGPISAFGGVPDVTATTQPPTTPPPKKHVETLEDGTKIYACPGVDENGKSADFKITIISQEYGWVLESSTQVQDLDGNSFNLVDYLEEKGLQNDLEKAEDLIAIGAASCEGTFQRERRRGQERAMQLVAWLRQVRPNADHPRDLYTLNLGRHAEACDEGPDATVHQRLVTIVWVPKKETGVRLQEALYDAMTKLGAREELRLHPANYSLFRLRKAT